MEEIKFDLLTKEEIFGDENKKGQLDIFRVYGVKCAPTDKAILNGVYVRKTGQELKIEKEVLQNRPCWYWTKTMNESGKTIAVSSIGSNYYEYQTSTFLGVRPAVVFSTIKELCTDVKEGKGGILEVKCFKDGTYAVDEDMQNTLDKEYKANRMLQTKNGYYLYQGKEYERVKTNFSNAADSIRIKNKVVLSNKTAYKKQDPQKYVWCKVEEHILYVSKEKDIAVFKNAIHGGVPFNDKIAYNNSFEETYMYKSVLKDILQKQLKRSDTNESRFKNILNGFTVSKENSKALLDSKDINIVKGKIMTITKGNTSTNIEKTEEKGKYKVKNTGNN